MIWILVGTDRTQSMSSKVARFIEPMYQSQGVPTGIMKLEDVGLNQLDGSHYSGKKPKPKKLVEAVDQLLKADGLVVVCPEYNGSMPGALKYFIDYWKYPESFEYRPVCFIGLGGRFGGLRPVEHLQQVFGYRNAFIYPDRVFLSNVQKLIKEDKIEDDFICSLLESQALGFCRFIQALKAENLHPLTREERKS